MPTILVLLNLLHKETTSIPTHLKMISEGKLRRYQRKTTRLLQCRINQPWDSYNDGSTSLDRLLMECGQIYNGVIKKKNLPKKSEECVNVKYFNDDSALFRKHILAVI